MNQSKRSFGVGAAKGTLFAATFTLSILGTAGFAASPAIVHYVKIENVKFDPEVLEVKKGDVIIWKNKDIVPHTVTSDGNKTFDSGQINAEGEFKWKAKKSGEISYKCLFHPMMKAKLKVN